MKANLDVWIIHPDMGHKVVGSGRSGASWKSPRCKRGPCDSPMQVVDLQQVFFPNVRPLFPKKQTHLKVLEDALEGQFVEDGQVIWDTRFLKPMK